MEKEERGEEREGEREKEGVIEIGRVRETVVEQRRD